MMSISARQHGRALIACIACCVLLGCSRDSSNRATQAAAAPLLRPQCVLSEPDVCVRVLGKRRSVDGLCEVFIEIENGSGGTRDVTALLKRATVVASGGRIAALDDRSVAKAKTFAVAAHRRARVSLLFAATADSVVLFRGDLDWPVTDTTARDVLPF